MCIHFTLLLLTVHTYITYTWLCDVCIKTSCDITINMYSAYNNQDQNVSRCPTIQAVVWACGYVFVYDYH